MNITSPKDNADINELDLFDMLDEEFDEDE